MDHTASSEQPLLSIVIVNYETKGLLKYCLRGIAREQIREPHEVIVVDNASRDDSARMVQNLFPSVRLVVRTTNDGFAVGNNEGVRKARGKYCLIMNPDIVVRPGAITRLCAFLDAHPKVAAVGPRLTHPDGSLQYSCFRFPGLFIPLYRRTLLGKLPFARRALSAYFMEDADHTKAQPVDWLLGAAMFVRREAIERVGAMDERFFLYFEDIDWCRRFWQAGYEVWYNPAAVLTHFHQRLSAEATGLSTIFSRTTRTHIMSGIKYFLKWGF